MEDRALEDSATPEEPSATRPLPEAVEHVGKELPVEPVQHTSVEDEDFTHNLSTSDELEIRSNLEEQAAAEEKQYTSVEQGTVHHDDPAPIEELPSKREEHELTTDKEEYILAQEEAHTSHQLPAVEEVETPLKVEQKESTPEQEKEIFIEDNLAHLDGPVATIKAEISTKAEETPSTVKEQTDLAEKPEAPLNLKDDSLLAEEPTPSLGSEQMSKEPEAHPQQEEDHEEPAPLEEPHPSPASVIEHHFTRLEAEDESVLDTDWASALKSTIVSPLSPSFPDEGSKKGKKGKQEKKEKKVKKDKKVPFVLDPDEDAEEETEKAAAIVITIVYENYVKTRRIRWDKDVIEQFHC
jgi:hypothetical protein